MKKFLVVIVVFGLVFSIFSSFNSISFAQKKYKEAPMLADLVKQGKLPPVEERLPENPLVIKPVEEVGTYGGDLKIALLGPGDTANVYWPFIRESFLAWDITGTKPTPNLVEKWNITQGGRAFVFYLRKGIKWSDGEPFTAEDVMFWYEDILLNKDLTPMFPAWLTTAGSPVKITKVNDYTVKFEFNRPNPGFLETMTFKGSESLVIYPKHYLKQFHPKYTPIERLKEMAQKGGFTEWYQLFANKNDYIQNPDRPTLNAWITTGALAGKTTHTLVRNPYYWKVDTAGNQLPYIDRVVATIAENTELVNMRVLNGEIDLDFGHLTLPNYPLLKDNESKGGYRVFLYKTMVGSQLALMPNLNHKDPVLNKLFNNRNFRIALSLSINRDEINQLCFLGLAEPRQATVVRECPYYTEGIDKLYTEYNPKRSNEILDSLGLTKRDKDGFRLRPDGKTLAITIEYPPLGEFGPWNDMIELVARYWQSIGIKTAPKSIDRSLFEVRDQSGELDVVVWAWGRGLHPLIEPRFVFPCVPTETGGPLYALWYSSGGKSGKKPSGDVLKAVQLYDTFQITTDPEKRLALGKELIKLSAENLWSIGTVGIAPVPVVVKNNLRNVPEKSFREWVCLQISHTRPEQFFFKK